MEEKAKVTGQTENVEKKNTKINAKENKQEEIDEVKAVDIALGLSDYEDDELKEFCDKLTDEDLAGILEESEEKTQIRMIEMITNKRVIKLFSYMSKDDIVDILGEIKIGRAKTLINVMKEGDKKVIKELLGYKDDCAGGLMTTEFIAINNKLTIDQAIKEIKAIAPKTELIDTIFILNSNKEMVGTAQLRDILVEREEATIEEITNNNFVSVEPETDQEEVARLASKYDLTAIPVLNKRKAILGIITIDDIVDVMVEEQTEDVLKMGGVAKEETLDSTLWESIKLRFPWLFINLLTAFLAAMTVKSFETTIEKVVALSATMSIVSGMGGNAGTQTVSIIIRNIAMGKVKLADAWHLLVKEILLGLINGAGIGIITGIVVSMIYGNIYLGIIIFLAMIGNLIVAGFFGLLIPLVLDKFKMDPALASSIFLTTATDVLGFFIFLSLANIFIGHLI